MDAWLSTLVLAGACVAWIVHTERRREQRRRAALAIAERVARWGQVRGFESNPTPNFELEPAHTRAAGSTEMAM